ncbi:DJ-1/PfpI family protein [Streptomyces sp. NPDC051105]|uniref:DJ-1/PfpI family protein n=1 Tax=Streptomyces sp. NPDC051105 TaxID=3154843 RepID=UPI00341EAC18
MPGRSRTRAPPQPRRPADVATCSNPKDPEVHRDLVRAQEAGVTIASVCTGVLVLSAAGLTSGRPCTTHHLGKADLAAQGGRVIDARVVDDGNLVTAGGVTS